jgi:hypothetical protein
MAGRVEGDRVIELVVAWAANIALLRSRTARYAGSDEPRGAAPVTSDAPADWRLQAEIGSVMRRHASPDVVDYCQAVAATEALHALIAKARFELRAARKTRRVPDVERVTAALRRYDAQLRSAGRARQQTGALALPALDVIGRELWRVGVR